MTDVDATLVVDDGAGGSRALSIDDFKAAATGDATQTTLAAVLAKLSGDPASQTTLAAILAKLIATPATEAKQDSLIAANHTDLAAILAKLSADPATQTTLAAVLAKLSSDPATQTTLAAVLAKQSADPSTGAKQDTQATKLDTLHTDLVALQGFVDGLEGKDYATQTTLAAVLAKIIAAPSTEAKQDALIALLPTALSSGRFKVEASPTSGTTFSVESSAETGTVYNGTTALTPKYAFANVAASQTDSSIVAAVTSKKIRVLAAFAIAGATATDLTFNTKPAGAGSAKTAKLANGANGGAVLPFNQTGWFETASGEGLTVTTGAGSTTGIQVVYVEV